MQREPALVAESDPGSTNRATDGTSGVPWAEAADAARVFREAFPDEPLVPVSGAAASPISGLVEIAARWEQIGFRVVRTVRPAEGVGNEEAGDGLDVLRQLDEVEDVLYRSGPAAAAKHWEAALRLNGRVTAVDMISSRFPPGIGFGPERERMERAAAPGPGYVDLPRFDARSDVDALLYLAARGRVAAGVPLRAARVLADARFGWRDRFGGLSLRGISSGFTLLPPGSLLLDGVRVDEQPRLVIPSSAGSPRVLSEGWRVRGRAGAATLGVPEVAWPTPAAVEPRDEGMLYWSGKRVVWLSPADPPERVAVECQRYSLPLVRLDGLLDGLADYLGHWRSRQPGPADAQRRREQWQAVRPGSDEMVWQLGEGILAAFAPWPEPFELRTPGDREWGWPPAQCQTEVRATFGKLVRAPIRQEPPDLAATLLYLVQNPTVPCHVWPGEFRGMWHFKLRTQDHTWIYGRVWRVPGGGEASGGEVSGDVDLGPLRVLPPQVGSGFALQLEAGDVRCEIVERQR